MSDNRADVVGWLLISAVICAFIFLIGYLAGFSQMSKVVASSVLCETQSKMTLGL